MKVSAFYSDGAHVPRHGSQRVLSQPLLQISLCDPGQVPLLLGASVSPSQKSDFETCPSGKDYCNPFGDIGSRILLALHGCLELREVERKPPEHTLTSRARGTYSLLCNVTCSKLSLRICRVTSGPLASSVTNL